VFADICGFAGQVLSQIKFRVETDREECAGYGRIQVWVGKSCAVSAKSTKNKRHFAWRSWRWEGNAVTDEEGCCGSQDSKDVLCFWSGVAIAAGRLCGLLRASNREKRPSRQNQRFRTHVNLHETKHLGSSWLRRSRNLGQPHGWFLISSVDIGAGRCWHGRRVGDCRQRLSAPSGEVNPQRQPRNCHCDTISLQRKQRRQCTSPAGVISLHWRLQTIDF
jgi:hypothetical protein